MTIATLEFAFAVKKDDVTAQRHAELQRMLKQQIKADKHVGVMLQCGGWVMGKAAGKPHPLKVASQKGSELFSKGTWVVEMYQYEESGSFLLLGREKCKKYLCDCDCDVEPSLKPADWEPCFKRHKTVYRLRDVRQLVGCTLSPPRESTRSTAKRQKAKTSKDDRLFMKVSL